MKKVILFNMLSLDGFFSGPNGEIDWHNVDEEFNDFALRQVDSVDTLLFGRVTYELMASYWPTTSAAADDPEIASRMNTLPKLVFSRTLANADWQNTQLVRDDAVAEISRLKLAPGKDMIIFGSANLAGAFIQHGLIDEFRLMVAPVILGKGRPMFQDLPDKLNLQFIRTQAFRSGNVLLVYRPA